MTKFKKLKFLPVPPEIYKGRVLNGLAEIFYSLGTWLIYKFEPYVEMCEANFEDIYEENSEEDPF